MRGGLLANFRAGYILIAVVLAQKCPVNFRLSAAAVDGDSDPGGGRDRHACMCIIR